MTDFLSRLIERSVGTAPIAKPMIPPLFGPAEVVPETNEEVEWTTRDPVLPEALPVADDPGREPSPPGPTVLPPPMMTSPRLDETRAGEDVAPSFRGPLLTADLLGERHRPPSETGARPAPRAAALRSGPREVLARRVPVSGPKPVESIAPLTSPQPSNTSALPPAEVIPQVQERRAGPHPSDPEKGAPVVRVTIGRIEVKAITQAAPSRQQAPRKTAAVSLEDYLRPRRRDR